MFGLLGLGESGLSFYPFCVLNLGFVFRDVFILARRESALAYAECRFFRSKFHCFDALVIVAGFVIDVLLRGVLEEVAELVIVLRLWRVFKIIEELSVGAEEQMEGLNEKIEALEEENRDLRAEMRQYKASGGQEQV